VPTLYTAERCPYAARARIVLAEKGLDYDAVEIDLDDRPAWLYEKNPLGRVPVYEEDGGFVLPESEVIMEYLEERYAVRRGTEGAREELDAKLGELDRVLEGQPYLAGREYGLADIGYVPWLLRAMERLDVELEPFPALASWLERVAARPAVAAERELVSAG
jgi:glutathione S-transferase